LTKGAAAKVKTASGGCLCGQIRFEAVGGAGKPHSCSCKMCQRHSGALSTVWVEYPRDAVTWSGPGGAPALYRSSPKSSRAFCPTCGSSLGAVDDAPVVALLLGSFDANNRKEYMPKGHSYRSAAPRWWHVESAVAE